MTDSSVRPQPQVTCLAERCVFLDSFTNLALSLLQVRDFSEAVHQTTQVIHATVGQRPWGLFLFSSPSKTLKLVAGRGGLESHWKQTSIEVAGPLEEWISEPARSPLLRQKDPAWLNAIPISTDPELSYSLSIFPVSSGVNFAGLLVLQEFESPHTKILLPIEMQTLATASAVLAVVLGNLVLQRSLEMLASTDPLTGLANRRVFYQRLQQEIERTKHTGSVFSLILLDLDHFKTINDTWGHAAGDQVLKVFAQIMQSVARRTDTAARIGGDEFALLTLGTSSAEANRLIGRMRLGVEKWPVEVGSQSENYTIAFSAGIRVVDPLRPEAIFDQTDNILYQDKYLHHAWSPIDYHGHWATDAKTEQERAH